MPVPTMDANLAGAGGSPKALFQCFYYDLAKHYFNDVVFAEDDAKIERGIALFIALCCPDEKEQERLWTKYCEIKDGTNDKIKLVGGNSAVTAATLTTGALTVYLNSVLEFTEKSTGGFL